LSPLTTSITLGSNKIRNGVILLPANPGPPGKMTVKTETEVWYGMVWYGIVEFNVPLDTV